jgi:hypothetical protein
MELVVVEYLLPTGDEAVELQSLTILQPNEVGLLFILRRLQCNSKTKLHSNSYGGSLSRRSVDHCYPHRPSSRAQSHLIYIICIYSIA